MLAPQARAQVQNSGNADASISLYLLPGTTSLQCSSIDLPDCENDVLQGEGDLFTPYYAVLAVFNADGDEGIRGLSCGIDYNPTSGQGVDLIGSLWTLCTDGLEFSNGNWPNSGAGNRITWTTCQNEEPGGKGTGVTAIAGFFYVSAYSNDTFRVTTNNGVAYPEFEVGDCNAQVTTLSYPAQAGWVGFSDDGSVKGNVQCGKPKEDTTWGDVKARYGNR